MSRPIEAIRVRRPDGTAQDDGLRHVERTTRGVRQLEQSGISGMSLEDTLSDSTDTFRFCGMDVLPSFGIFDIFKNPTIKKDLAAYKGHLAESFA